MHDNDIRAALTRAVDNTLSDLSGDPWLAKKIIAAQTREEPVMKKKLSVSFALVLALMLLTLSAALALMNSTIGDRLFGGHIPDEVAEHILTPQQTAEAPMGHISVDELLYDGSALHMSFTITNPAAETLLYTVDGIRIGGVPVNYDGLSAEGAGDAGYLLGGSVDGVQLPENVTMYNKASVQYLFDEGGAYLGTSPLPEGDVTLEVSVAVWRPIRAPRLVNYDDYEGVNVTETADSLLTDKHGYSMLWLMRPADMQANTAANVSAALAYAEIYETLGWAELVEISTISIPVELTMQVPHAVPAQRVLHWNELTITLDSMALTHAGGAIEGSVRGDEQAVAAFMRDGLQAVDTAGQRELSTGCWTEDDDAETGYMHFHITLAPIAGELPDVVTLAPMLADDPRWNPVEKLYDPSLPKPDGVIGSGQYDFTRSIDIPMDIQ